MSLYFLSPTLTQLEAAASIIHFTRLFPCHSSAYSLYAKLAAASDVVLPIPTNSIKLATMNSKQVIKQLETEGWFLRRIKGSHHHFKHPTKAGLVTVKHPDSDIPIGTLRSIEKQAGWR